MTDQSRGGCYIDDGSGPVHVDDLPKSKIPAQESAPAVTEAPSTEPEHSDV